MHLTDLISALQHVAKEHGNLRVLEERPSGWDSTEFFPDGIEIDRRVQQAASYFCGKHVFDKARNVKAGEKDRREFKAFIL